MLGPGMQAGRQADRQRLPKASEFRTKLSSGGSCLDGLLVGNCPGSPSSLWQRPATRGSSEQQLLVHLYQASSVLLGRSLSLRKDSLLLTQTGIHALHRHSFLTHRVGQPCTGGVGSTQTNRKFSLLVESDSFCFVFFFSPPPPTPGRKIHKQIKIHKVTTILFSGHTGLSEGEARSTTEGKGDIASLGDRGASPTCKAIKGGGDRVLRVQGLIWCSQNGAYIQEVK